MGLDCILLGRLARKYPPPYAIWSLQGYPWELVRSSRMDITLDDELTILDEHYNNVKALDTLNQELFQLWMGEKETISDWGVFYQGTSKSWPLHFQSASLTNCIAELKHWLLLWGATQMAQGHGGIPEGQPMGEDIFWLSTSCKGNQKGRFHGTLPKPNCW